ncbi:MAG: hypothetical protein LHW64_05945 [Candidatus Cloacimonetes bacterium]|jgi:type IV pilus assembly protein PilQ|nr:hypothetical protein [Candidatus Cloacimonadota bacterium]MCB5287325.1 hypothetical protein [Candidatus Cloacimonadota bacterium]MCK9184075.1 hypothetical protein [Candidatus Cloacimonadota bacterium]MCK9584104.1 hypothetical protein [Candidatus Cloacimonadota bacterium]MDY0229647.1 hypothetical protein [Candidatus Cloacimonadaceae bacterium]
MNKYYLILLILTLSLGLLAEEVKLEKVSLSAEMRLNEAVQALEPLFVRDTGKKLINMSSYNGPIGVAVSNLPYDRAFKLILLQNSLIRTDAVGYIAITDPKDFTEDASGRLIPIVTDSSEEKDKLDPDAIDGRTKQIRIKAVAMLADRSYLKALGIDWSTVLNGKVTINAGFQGASQVSSLMNLSGSGTADLGKHSVDINTLIKTIESDQKGSIIAQPNILVSSGKTGHIQVGQDISIKSVDEAGNTTDSFTSTGVIMDVTPTIVVVEGIELIHLELSIERSSGVPSDVSTVITKSSSSTDLILYNGEETAIAGLFDVDETVVRSGIPVLKDLPWWVFGIRYLTGYDSKEKKERELIITIQAEIVDNALERLRKARALEKASQQ